MVACADDIVGRNEEFGWGVHLRHATPRRVATRRATRVDHG